MLDALFRVGLRVAFQIQRVLWFVLRPDVHGAYVAVWWEDRLLLIRNSYRAGETLPCGAIARGEAPVQAAARELREEVGLIAAESDLSYVGEVVIDFEYKTDHAHFFELHLQPATTGSGAEAAGERDAAERRGAPAVRIDRREVVWATFLPRDTLGQRPLVPQVRRYLARLAVDAPAGDDENR